MRGSSYPEHPILDLRGTAVLNRSMGGSGLAISPIAIAISAIVEAAGSIFPAVANLSSQLVIFATAGLIELSIFPHCRDLHRDMEVLWTTFTIPFGTECWCVRRRGAVVFRLGDVGASENLWKLTIICKSFTTHSISLTEKRIQHHLSLIHPVSNGL